MRLEASPTAPWSSAKAQEKTRCSLLGLRRGYRHRTPRKGPKKNKNIYQIIEVQPVAKATYQNIYQNIYQIIEA